MPAWSRGRRGFTASTGGLVLPVWPTTATTTMAISNEQDLPIEWRLPFLIGRSPLAHLLGGEPPEDLLAGLEADIHGDDRTARRSGVAGVGFAWLAMAMACLAVSVVLAVASAVITGHPVTTWPTVPMVVGLPCAAGGIALVVGGLLPRRAMPDLLLRVIFDAVFAATFAIMIVSQT